jgi:hypothetical protein
MRYTSVLTADNDVRGIPFAMDVQTLQVVAHAAQSHIGKPVGLEVGGQVDGRGGQRQPLRVVNGAGRGRRQRELLALYLDGALLEHAELARDGLSGGAVVWNASVSVVETNACMELAPCTPHVRLVKANPHSGSDLLAFGAQHVVNVHDAALVRPSAVSTLLVISTTMPTFTDRTRISYCRKVQGVRASHELRSRGCGEPRADAVRGCAVLLRGMGPVWTCVGDCVGAVCRCRGGGSTGSRAAAARHEAAMGGGKESPATHTERCSPAQGSHSPASHTRATRLRSGSRSITAPRVWQLAGPWPA